MKKGLAAIIEQIEKEGLKERDRIISEAQREADKIEGEARERASLILKEGEEKAKRIAKERYNQLMAHARLKVRMEELKVKNNALEEIYLESEKQLVKFVKSVRYKKYLANLLKSLPNKPSYIHVIKRDAKLVGSSYKVKSDLTEDVLGGFVAEYEDYNLDLTLRTKLDEFFDDHRAEIYKRCVSK